MHHVLQDPATLILQHVSPSACWPVLLSPATLCFTLAGAVQVLEPSTFTTLIHTHSLSPTQTKFVDPLRVPP